MKDLHFNSLYDLKEFLSYLTEIGSGREATCYLYKNYVIKYLTGPEAIILPLEEALQFKNIKIDSFIFTQAIMFLKGKIVGYIMPYVSGKTLFDKSISEYYLSKMVKACSKKTEDIHLLSQEQILMFDVFTPNIIYNNGKLYFIDTNNYSFSKNNEENIFDENISQFSKSIIKNMNNNETLSNFISRTPSLKNMSKDIELLRKPADILELVKEELIPYCGNDFKTLQQAVKRL